MNKYQEAFEDLWSGCPNPKEQVESKEILQELVDKETPMKPKFVNKLDWTCPRCDAYHTKFVQYYCEYCGQKLDWSDSND